MHAVRLRREHQLPHLLEDGRIVGTPNAEFHEALMTPSTQPE